MNEGCLEPNRTNGVSENEKCLRTKRDSVIFWNGSIVYAKKKRVMRGNESKFFRPVESVPVRDSDLSY